MHRGWSKGVYTTWRRRHATSYNHRNFSVNMFYRHKRVGTGAMLLFLVTLKIFDVLWELHALFSEGVYKPLVGVSVCIRVG